MLKNSGEFSWVPFFLVLLFYQVHILDAKTGDFNDNKQPSSKDHIDPDMDDKDMRPTTVNIITTTSTYQGDKTNHNNVNPTTPTEEDEVAPLMREGLNSMGSRNQRNVGFETNHQLFILQSGGRIAPVSIPAEKSTRNKNRDEFINAPTIVEENIQNDQAPPPNEINIGPPSPPDDLDLGIADEINKTQGIDGQQLETLTEFVLQKHGITIDFAKLVHQFTLVCPLAESCNLLTPDIKGYRIDNKFVCPHYCKCDFRCITHGNCCPGSIYAYMEHTCTNVLLYPQEGDPQNYPLVSKCPIIFKDPDVIQRCEGRSSDMDNKSNVQPVTSFETNVAYKNRFCAFCNGDKNFTEWQISVRCPDGANIQDDFESWSDMKEHIDKNDCVLAFDLDDRRLKPQKCFSKQDETFKLIDTCNTTGLWLEEDPDLVWACEHFNEYKYLNFKNVFCFLCNPSIVSVNTPTTVNQCNMTGKWDVYDPVLESLCVHQPEVSRLSPYKNAYCLICNSIKSLSQYKTTNYRMEGFDITVNEKVTEDGTLLSSLSVEVDFYGKEKIKDFVGFLEHHYNGDSIHRSSNAYDGEDIDVTNEIIQQYVDNYFSICGTKESCNQGINDSTSIGNPVCNSGTKQCSCDQNCLGYGTCCTDIILRYRPYACVNTSNVLQIEPAQMSEINIGHESTEDACHLMVNKCLEQSSHYLNSTFSERQSELLSMVPVVHGYMTYRNITYLLCNADNLRTIQIGMSIQCDTYFEKSLLQGTDNADVFINLTTKYCRTTFVKPTTRYFSSGSDLRHTNRVELSVVEALPDIIPHIPPSMLTTESDFTIWNNVKEFTQCNQTGKWTSIDDTTQFLCEHSSALSATLDNYAINGLVYKNYACYLCNPEIDETTFPVEDIISSCNVTGLGLFIIGDTERMCRETELHTRWLPFKNYYCSLCNLPPVHSVVYFSPPILRSEQDYGTSFVSYRTLFSLSMGDFTQLTKEIVVPECANGTFDYVLEMCRPLFCTKGRLLQNNTCKSLLETAESLTYELDLTLNLVDQDTPTYNKDAGECDMGNLTKTDKLDLTVVLDVFKADVVNQIAQNDETASQLFMGCEIATDIHCLHPDSGGDNIVYLNMLQEIKINCPLFVFKTSQKTAVESVLVDALMEDYKVPTVDGKVVCLKATPKAVSISDAGFMINKKCSYNELQNVYLDSKIQPVDRFMTCVQIHLDETEYESNNATGDLVLAKSNIEIKSEFYYSDGSGVRMCLADYSRLTAKANSTEAVPENDMLIIYNRISEVCTVLSMVCLLATFVTYCLFHSLRTVPGKNNMALCFCLFTAQALLQFGLNVEDVDGIPICVVIGVCLHYFWLATFFSMNVCSFHMFRVFCSHAMSVPSSSKRRFTKYIVYVFGMPCLIASATLTVYLVSSDGSSTGYGINRCFLSNFYGVLCAFIVPSAIVFISNFIFFITAFHKIRTSPRIQSSGDKREFFVYIKLCTVVGLTWPLQIVDAMLPLTIFSFFVVGLNALQGVFVFLSYVCNRRVFFLYKKSCSKEKSVISSSGTFIKTTSTQSTELAERSKRNGV